MAKPESTSQAQPQPSPQTQPQPPARSITTGEVVKAGLIALMGTFMDGYDLVIAVTLGAIVFPKVFFPPSVSPGLALFYSLVAVTLVGYVFRPVGALIFGHIGDRLGRKVGLVWDLLLTGIGALIIAVAPSYSAAGYLGLAVVVLGRIIISIGLGGEQGGAISLAVEQANASGSRWRGFWGALPTNAWPVVAIATSLVLAALSAAYPGASFVTFGWRIAFYIGFAVAIIGIIVRWILLESYMFEEARRTVGVAKSPAIEVFKHWKAILGGAFLYALSQMGYYFYVSLGPSYAQQVGLPQTLSFLAVVVAALVVILVGSMFAILGDMFGRRPIIMIVTPLMIPVAVAYPLLILTKSFAGVALALTLMAIAGSAAGGLGEAYTAEQFPTRYRYSGTGLGIQIGGLIGGGIALPIIGLLIGNSFAQRWWVIPVVMAIYSVLATLAPRLLMKETLREKLTH